MSGFWLDARVYLGDWWGEDSGKPSETRKPARGGLFGVFRRLSETGLNSYMVPRRHLNTFSNYMIYIDLNICTNLRDTWRDTRGWLLADVGHLAYQIRLLPF